MRVLQRALSLIAGAYIVWHIYNYGLGMMNGGALILFVMASYADFRRGRK